MKPLLYLALCVVCSLAKETYDGYMVVRVVPSTKEQLAYLRSIHDALDGRADEIDFWRKPSALNNSVDIMFSPEVQKPILDGLRDAGLDSEILHSNLADSIYRQMEPVSARSAAFPWWPSPPNFFSSYRRLSEIHTYMQNLASDHSDKVKLSSIGKSYKGRDLRIMQISNGINDGKEKPIIWIDAGLHAREWIGPATAMYIADQLIKNPQNDSEISSLLDKATIVILPVSNPDGYEYTFTTNRMWRKTRSQISGNRCIGTDPNRNWDVYFGVVGASKDPCSDTYCGPNPFSEVETKMMANFLHNHQSNIKMYLTLHSYSQVLLTPYGHTSALPPDYNEMKRVGEAGLKDLESKYGTRYTFGTSTNVLYPASGGSDDYAYSKVGIKYSYTFELRDTGRYGFLLPPSQIKPTGEETFAGIKTMIKIVFNL